MSATSIPLAEATSVSNALARNRLGPFAIGSAIASSVAPLTVITLVVPLALAATGLIGFPIAIAAVAGILMIYAVGYLAMARHIPNAGAFYAYVAAGIGRPLGVGTSWGALATYCSFQLCCYGAFGAAIGAPLLTSWVGFDVPWYIPAFLAWMLVAFLGANEIKLSGYVLVFLVIAETVLVVVYSVVIALAPGFAFSAAAMNVSDLSGPMLGVFIVLGATSFAGVEQSVVYIEESKDPRRTIPVATYVTIGTIGAVYMLASWVQISAAGPQPIDRATAEGADLFFNEAATVLGRSAVTVGKILLGTGLIAALLAFHNAITRYAFALGREGVLFRVFGRTTIKGAPRNASLAQTGLAFVVLTMYALAGWDPLVQLFYWGSTAGGLGVLLLYTLTSIAVIAYFARDARGENLWQRLIAPFVASVILLGVTYLAVDNLAALFGVEPGTGPARVVPIAYLVIFAAGTGWGLILKRRNPAVYDGIGRGTRSATASGLSAVL
ncbi:APC family permease [Phytohabitans aurantiacus]|uniref:Amino acid permease n=1 Tax=Phytohabitans aurantiacus TaxID=3016789 RepID=A0ABQ5R2Q5_9ACTN|nr:APC family permease [Phytohabitans aurantiacus]GLH99870.1 amino acid permease [Phytohabitans aurantiacus]